MTRSKNYAALTKQTFWKLHVYGETHSGNGTRLPEVTVFYEFVDAVAMRLVQWPNSYDVLITENYWDILTDEASVISGSMGLMPSASVGEHTSLYEPIHGSYPHATG